MSDAMAPVMLGLRPTADAGATDSAQGQQAAKLRQAAEGFERALLRQMLKEVRQSSLSAGQSTVNQGYSQIADDHLADHLARAGGLGLADAMARQMIQQIQKAGLTKAP